MIAFGITAPAAVGLIIRFLGEVEDVESVTMTIENSPWVTFDVRVHLRPEFKFALWRSTGQVFLLDWMGAAGDEPVPSLQAVLDR
jgi:hypothetical protein